MNVCVFVKVRVCLCIRTCVYMCVCVCVCVCDLCMYVDTAWNVKGGGGGACTSASPKMMNGSYYKQGFDAFRGFI